MNSNEMDRTGTLLLLLYVCECLTLEFSRVCAEDVNWKEKVREHRLLLIRGTSFLLLWPTCSVPSFTVLNF